MEYQKILDKLAGAVKEPLGAIVCIFCVLFVIIAMRYDLSKDQNHIVLFCFLALFVLALVGLVVYALVVGNPSRNGDEIHAGDSQGKSDMIDRLRAELNTANAELKVAKDKLEMSDRVRAWKDHERWLDARSIDTDLDIPERLVDRAHHYEELQFRGSISDTGDYTGVYVRKGHRATDGKTHFMHFRVGASSMIEDADSLGLKAIDLLTGKALNCRIEEDSDYICKLFRIELAKTLSKGDEFAIQIQFHWPDCVDKARDSDTIDLSMFSLGVDKLRHELDFPFDPQGVALYEINGNEIIPSDVGPEIREDGDLCRLRYEVEQPKAKGYVIAFSRPLRRAA